MDSKKAINNLVKRTPKELYQELIIQINFLKDECQHFDSGDIYYAKKIALTLRILFYDTKNSSSLLKQLSNAFLYKFDKFTNLAYKKFDPKLENTNFIRTSLADYTFNHNYNSEPYLKPRPFRFTTYQKCKQSAFKSWWKEQIVIFIDKYTYFTREKTVTLVADKIGGAHIDPTIPDYFSDILNNETNHLSILTTLDNNTEKTYIALPEETLYASIRTIAEEAINTIESEIIPYCEKHLL